MKFLNCLCVLFLALALTGRVSAQDPIVVETRLEQTAFFVGEPITYRVLVRYGPSTQIILDRLQEKNFQMEPFQLISLDISQTEEATFNLLAITLKLVSYEINQDEWRIPPFNLYYIQEDGPVDIVGESIVESWTVPALPIAFRSVRPDDTVRIRDFIGVHDLEGPFWIALLLGLSGGIVIVIPVGLAVMRRLQGVEVETQLERSEIRKESARALRALGWGVDEDSDVIPLYEDLGRTLRRYTGEISEKGGSALTAGEIQETLLAAGEGTEEAQQISELVALVDQVLYSSGGAEQGKDRLQEIHSKAVGLFEE